MDPCQPLLALTMPFGGQYAQTKSLLPFSTLFCSNASLLSIFQTRALTSPHWPLQGLLAANLPKDSLYYPFQPCFAQMPHCFRSFRHGPLPALISPYKPLWWPVCPNLVYITLFLPVLPKYFIAVYFDITGPWRPLLARTNPFGS